MIQGIASLGPRDQTSVAVHLKTGVVHLVGGIVGGGSMAAVAWLVATPVRTLLPNGGVLGLFAVFVALNVAVDLRWVGSGTSRGRQVPATWRQRYGHYSGFAGFGGTLGAGVATFVPYAITYVVFAAAAVLLPLGSAVVCGIVFGGARAAIAAAGSTNASLAGRVFQRIIGMRRLGTLASVGLALTILVVAAIPRAFA